MEVLENKKLWLGAAVVAVIVGLYFGLGHVSEEGASTETTTSQTQDAPTTSTTVVPVVNVEQPKITNPTTSAPTAEETQVNSIKNENTDETEAATE